MYFASTWHVMSAVAALIQLLHIQQLPNNLSYTAAGTLAASLACQHVQSLP
jgi:hypothetical protein